MIVAQVQSFDYTVFMYTLIIVLAACIPSVALGHGSGAVVPAPVPVTMAVYAGICAVVATWLMTFRMSGHYPTHRSYHLSPWSLPVFLILFFAAVLVTTAYDALPFLWWFGVMTIGVVISAVVSFPVYTQAKSNEGFSLAPLFLYALFAAEFFIPQFHTTKGLFFVLMLYTLVVTLALILFGRSVLRHELVTRFISALGSATPVRNTTSRHLTSTDQWLITTFVVATSFDGLLHSEYWRSWCAYWGIDVGAVIPSLLFFAGAICVFNLCYFITMMLMRDDIHAISEYRLSTLAHHFVPAFVPIAVGYCLAHNLTRIPELFVDEYIVYTWGMQLTCIIVGHVLSVFVSHERAWALFGDATRVRKSQFSMTVFMVIITGVSIMMLQAPL